MNIEELAFKNIEELEPEDELILYDIIDFLQKDRKQWINQYTQVHNDYVDLKKQLEYLRSGEYLNQLKFERNMLENIVQNMEVSKEDKEFIDMTHRNTELLEENQKLKEKMNCDLKWALKYDELFFENKQLKDRISNAIEKIDEDIEDLSKYIDNNFVFPSQVIKSYQFYLDLLKEDNKEE